MVFISYAVIVYLHGISVKYFVELVLCWKKCFPIFLTKFALYGRLNHIIFYPYVKHNNKTTYVNTESNRTISIIKQLPKSIELRLSPLSAFKEIFKNSIKPFKEALTKEVYKHEMECQQNKFFSVQFERSKLIRQSPFS